MNKVIICFCLLISVPISFLNAQAPTPCSGEGYQQFDFWVGEWDVFSTSADTLVGQSKINKILNGCVIEENWTGGTGFKGKSFNTYNSLDSTWNQVWVDVSGATYHFSGQYQDNKMSLKGETANKKGKALFTLTFENNQIDKTVRQVWKMSTDEGENWNVLFDGTYRPKK